MAEEQRASIKASNYAREACTFLALVLAEGLWAAARRGARGFSFWGLRVARGVEPGYRRKECSTLRNENSSGHTHKYELGERGVPRPPTASGGQT